MNSKERFLAALNKEEVDRVSVACPLQTATVEMMEEYGTAWPEAHSSAQNMAKLALAANRLGGIESVRVPFDLCVEAEALGSAIHGGNSDSQPSIKDPVLSDPEKFYSLEVPNPSEAGRMPVVLEAIKLVKEEDPTLPIIAGITGPFTLAGQIRGVEALLMDMFDNPSFFKALLSFTTEVLVSYGRALEKAGADAVVVIDPSAGSELLGSDFYQEAAYPPCSKLVHSLEKPAILHICGDSTPLLEMMADTGVAGVSLDHLVDIRKAKELVGDRVAIIGNINPPDTLFLGSPEDVRAESLECIARGVDILAPGCGIPPGTKLENIRAMAEAANAAVKE